MSLWKYIYLSPVRLCQGVKTRHSVQNKKLMVLFSSQVLPHFPCFSLFYFFNNFLLAFFSSWSPKCGSAVCMTNFKGSQWAGYQSWASVTWRHTELSPMSDTSRRRRPLEGSDQIRSRGRGAEFLSCAFVLTDDTQEFDLHRSFSVVSQDCYMLVCTNWPSFHQGLLAFDDEEKT